MLVRLVAAPCILLSALPSHDIFLCTLLALRSLFALLRFRCYSEYCVILK